MKKADFSRSIVTSMIKVAEVKVVNGKLETVELPSITSVGTTAITNEKAMKIAKAKYKAVATLVVLSVETREEVRGMDFETFMKYSVPVERPASQRKDK